MTGDLFPPFNDTDTSFEAAESVAESAAAKRAIVFRIIETQPSTCDAIEGVTGWAHQTVSARIWELHDKQKRIVDSGERRLTRRGRRAIVWRAVDESHPWVPIRRPTRPPLKLLQAGAVSMHTALDLLGEDVLGEGFVAILRWVDEIIETAPPPTEKKSRKRKKKDEPVDGNGVDVPAHYVEAIL